MKLLHIPSRCIVDLSSTNRPRYALLSHTWGRSTTTLSDPSAVKWATDHRLNKHLILLPKILKACDVATAQGIDYLWVDWLCINSASSTALEENINGAFQLLKGSSLCMVYLDDLDLSRDERDEPPRRDTWSQCRYWTRAWTLQELVIPTNVHFYDASWSFCGEKSSPAISNIISTITGVPEAVLANANVLWETSLAVRMSWAAHRECQREEDIAYCLVALTGITIQVRYGEGSENAFLRLQEEILRTKRDGSILAWRSQSNQPRGLLAVSPQEFNHFSYVDSDKSRPWVFDGKIAFDNRGISIKSLAQRHGGVSVLDIGRDASGKRWGIYLAEWNGIYLRLCPALHTGMSKLHLKSRFHATRHLDGCVSAQLYASIHFVRLEQEVLQSRSAMSSAQDMVRGSEISPLPIRPSVRSIVHRPADSASSLPESIGSKRHHSGRVKGPVDESGAPSRSSTFVFDDEALHIVDNIDEEEHTECDWDGDSDGTRSETDTDYDSEDSEQWCRVGSDSGMLSADEEFRVMRPLILDHAFQQFKSWIAIAQYVVPPDDKLSSGKRVRLSVADSAGVSTEANVRPKIAGHFPLACPFYVQDPSANKTCLLRHHLRSITDLIRHLKQQHAQPRYCPTCFDTFDSILTRENHIRSNICQPRAPREELKGLDQSQCYRLTRYDDWQLGLRMRWLRIWATVFPGSDLTLTPYLQSGVAFAISLVRDHWPNVGSDLVSRFIPVKKAGKDGDVTAFHRKCRVCLHDLTMKIWDEFEQAKPGSCSNTENSKMEEST